MFKQPRGFYAALPAAICDRLSFYGLVSGIIILFMTLFHKTSAEGYQFYGQLTGLGFITPILGGVLADRFFRRVPSILLGLIYIALGNLICMSLNFHALLVGMSFMMVGIGLFGPNNISFTGSLYPEFSDHKEKGITFVYLGKNMGAILGPVFASVVLYVTHDYHYFFATTAALLLIPIYLFARYAKKLKATEETTNTIWSLPVFIGVTFAFVAFVYALLANRHFFNIVFSLSLVGVLGYIIVILKGQTAAMRRKMLFILALCFFNLFYLICGIQINSVLIVFGKLYSSGTLNLDIPVNWIASLEPASVLLLSPFIIWLSKKWGNNESSNLNLTLWKFFLSLLASALAYGLFYSGTALFTNSMVVLSLFFFGIVLIGFGELITSPPLFNAISNLIHPRYQGFFVALTLVIVSIADYLGSLLAKKMVGSSTVGIHAADYPKFFMTLGLITLGAATVFALLFPLLKKLATR